VWLWANMHGGFIFGLAMMGLWSGLRFLTILLCSRWESRRQGTEQVGRPGKSGRRPSDAPVIPFGTLLVQAVRQTWPLFAATAVSFLLCAFVNPFGFQNITHPFVVATIKGWREVAEWRPVYVYEQFGTVEEFLTVLGAVSGLMAVRVIVELAARPRKPTIEHVGMVAFSVVLSFAVAYVAISALKMRQDRAFPPSLTETFELAQMGFLLIAVIASAALCCLIVFILLRGFVRPSGLDMTLVTFEVIVTLVAIGMAIESRRFIPLAIIFCAPVAAVQFDWLLKSLRLNTSTVVAVIMLAVVGIAYKLLTTPDQSAADKARYWREVLPACLILLAPVVAIGLAQLLWLARTVWPTLALALVVSVPVAFLGRRQVFLYYWPGNPTVPEGSFAQKMVLYHDAFAPDAVEFINANQISGRAFNEWRWEGYLRWMCPQIKTFMGGRAQQVHDEATYNLRRRIIEKAQDARFQMNSARRLPGDAGSAQLRKDLEKRSQEKEGEVQRIFEQQGMHLAVMPADDDLVSALVGQGWVIVLAARHERVGPEAMDLVMTDMRSPQGRMLCERLRYGGRKDPWYTDANVTSLPPLTYPTEAIAKYSRLVFMDTLTPGGHPGVPVVTLNELATAAIELVQAKPMVGGYNVLARVAKAEDPNNPAMRNLLMSEDRRLSAMLSSASKPLDRIELLQCRGLVAGILANLPRESWKDAPGAPDRWRREQETIARQIQEEYSWWE
jgi:hypothetical protein